MQLLDLLPQQLLNYSTKQLLATLQDIASKVEIQSNFCISHPDYKFLELSDEVISRFQQLPLPLQSKVLRSQLTSFLYHIYYNGAFRNILAVNAKEIDTIMLQNLENNTYLGIDVDFSDRLESANSGKGYFDEGWQVLKVESDGTLAVKKGELTLHIQRDRHLHSQQVNATIGDVVAIKMPPYLTQNGFYLAVGNLGQYSTVHQGRDRQLVRVYFNLSPEGAVAVMHSLTRQLNKIPIPFTFKALYNPVSYDRYDTAVLYIEKGYYANLWPVLKSVYAEHQYHFGEEVPLFTKLLAPGLGLAEEPNSKFAEKESFGLNRCQIVTNGLLEAWEQGNESAENRMLLILKHFAQQQIELKRPYINPGSEDVYTTLE
ncbi:T3SS effector HopA1 family protein [Calothrix sp. NIES-2098]|uniref:T3SS effector HopA1 family protein n=1 Tax=Calothrix sp. NIES-2098 TaxID=1954171 RepID=UPI000BBC0F3E